MMKRLFPLRRFSASSFKLNSSLPANVNNKNTIIETRKNTQPTIYDFSGVSYAMPEYLAKKRLRIFVLNAIAGTLLTSFVGFVYFYSMWAVKQDDLTDDFLEQAELLAKKNKNEA